MTVAAALPGSMPPPSCIKRWSIDIPGCGLLDVFASRFSVTRFDPADFERCGIECPPRIACSVKKRQAEYLHGRLAAIAALQQIGFETRAIPSGMHREPLWPGGTVGSITHTDGLAAAAVLPATRGLHLGIDLEPVADGEALAALAQTVVSADERGRLAAHAPAHALTAVFSAKESFYKAAFAQVGRFFDFDALSVERLDPTTGSIHFTLRETLSDRLDAGMSVTVHHRWIEPSTVLTVCTLPADR